MSFRHTALALLAAGSVAHAGEPTATASYTVRFDATWSLASHPVDFPASAHFSGLVGGVHGDDVSFWGPGEIASNGIEVMAETGGKSPLLSEVNAAISAGDARQTISGPGIFPSPGVASASFTTSLDHPLATVVTMIAPSPDWFLGVHGESLLVDGEWVDELVVDLLPYDSGTDSGATFTSANQDTSPAEPIALITGFPLEGGVPLGTFTFTRTDVVPTWGDVGGTLAGSDGEPILVGDGELVDGGTVTFTTTGAASNAPAFVVVGLSVLDAPFKGGLLVPSPDLVIGLGTDGAGILAVGGPLPSGLPSGTLFAVQTWITDAAGPSGFAASNGICATVD